MKEKILITGITGQDGLFLIRKYLDQPDKYQIFGTSRNVNSEFNKKLNYLLPNLKAEIKIMRIDLLDYHSVFNFVSSIQPTKLINLSGPSSVYQSYTQPKKTIDSINKIFDNLTDSFFKINSEGVYFQALSSEMFLPKENEKINENSKISPRSPYAIGKAQIFEKSISLREKLGVNICNGILFNHESEFRNNEYLFMKVINKAIDISKSGTGNLTVGSLNLIRDWTYAGDIASAIFKIVKESNAEDYVVGSGTGHSIEELIQQVFDYFNLDLNTFVNVDTSLLRSGDPVQIISNPEKIYKELQWNATTSFSELISKCIQYKIKNI
jgi:GDPmannose 4,6-dehydratase